MSNLESYLEEVERIRKNISLEDIPILQIKPEIEINKELLPFYGRGIRKPKTDREKEIQEKRKEQAILVSQRKTRQILALLTAFENENPSLAYSLFSFYDIGSGRGALAKQLAYLYKGLVYAVDFNTDALQKATLLGLNIQTVGVNIFYQNPFQENKPFYVFALHLCGLGIDQVIKYSENNTTFRGFYAMPCCYGLINPENFSEIHSKTINSLGLKIQEIEALKYVAHLRASLSQHQNYELFNYAAFLINTIRTRTLNRFGFKTNLYLTDDKKEYVIAAKKE
ncbi:MAG: class I SAM-dependent methyltransferase [Candidatus Woesearchaeota archaeon]